LIKEDGYVCLPCFAETRDGELDFSGMVHSPVRILTLPDFENLKVTLVDLFCKHPTAIRQERDHIVRSIQIKSLNYLGEKSNEPTEEKLNEQR
jgi:hypothetical protein